jgi:hypothetical protein
VLSVYGKKKKLADMELMTRETDFQYLVQAELMSEHAARGAALFYSAPDNLRYMEFSHQSDHASSSDRDVSKDMGKFIQWIEGTTFATGLKESAFNVKRLLKSLNAERVAQKDEVLSLLSRADEE